MTENCKNNEYCCGFHEVCEKGLSPKPEVEYYDDEELDVFRGRDAGSYSPEEIEQFREVLETMYENEIPDWKKSLEQRGIRLPDELASH